MLLIQNNNSSTMKQSFFYSNIMQTVQVKSDIKVTKQNFFRPYFSSEGINEERENFWLFGWVLWHSNPGRLIYAKFTHTHTSNIYDL